MQGQMFSKVGELDEAETNNANEELEHNQNTFAMYNKRFGTGFKIIIFIAFYVIGTIFFNRYEGWNVIECIYFITVTSTTVGYGYFHPNHNQTKLFDIFFLLFGVTVILSFANEFAKFVLVGSQDELIYFVSRKLLKREEVSPRMLAKGRTICSVVGIAVALVVGTLFYSYNESWSVLNSLYWVVCTMTTVGYGDLTIKYDSTRLFATFYIFFVVLIYAVTFNNIIDERMLDLQEHDYRLEIASLPSSKFSGKWVTTTLGRQAQCSRERFILSVLVELDKVNYSSQVKPLMKLFRVMDIGNKGYLTNEELLSIRTRAERLAQKACDSSYALNPLHDVEALCDGVEMK